MPKNSLENTQRLMPLKANDFRTVSSKKISLLSFLGLILAWELSIRLNLLTSLLLPSPYDILQALYTLAASGLLWQHLQASLQRFLLGWSTGMSLGVFVGLLAGCFSSIRNVVSPWVSALFPIPKIALLPILIIWFGIGEGSKVMTIALGVFFPTVLATCSGVDNVDRRLITMGQSFNLSKSILIRRILLPGALPSILSSWRITLSIAIMLLIAAEMIGATYGIGAYMLTAGSLIALDQLLAGALILSIFWPDHS